jgi:hypothetical protein
VLVVVVVICMKYLLYSLAQRIVSRLYNIFQKCVFKDKWFSSLKFQDLTAEAFDIQVFHRFVGMERNIVLRKSSFYVTQKWNHHAKKVTDNFHENVLDFYGTGEFPSLKKIFALKYKMG